MKNNLAMLPSEMIDSILDDMLADVPDRAREVKRRLRIVAQCGERADAPDADDMWDNVPV